MHKTTRDLLIDTACFLRLHKYNNAAQELLDHINQYDIKETKQDRKQVIVNDKNRIAY